MRSPADGYTLLIVSNADAINAMLYENPNFDFIRDIALTAWKSHFADPTDARITLVHFSTSSAMNFLSSAGELAQGV